MSRRFFCLFVLALLGLTISSNAERRSIKTTEHHLLRKIIDNSQHCVAACEGDRIFICPESIISTDRGLFINLNGVEVCPLPLVQSSRRGYFIQGNLMQEIVPMAAKKTATKGPCPNCDQNTDERGRCTNSRCFFFQLRVL